MTQILEVLWNKHDTSVQKCLFVAGHPVFNFLMAQLDQHLTQSLMVSPLMKLSNSAFPFMGLLM